MGNVDVASLRNPENALNAALPTRTGEHAAVGRIRQARLAAKMEAGSAHDFLEGIKNTATENETQATLDSNFRAKYNDRTGAREPFKDSRTESYYTNAIEASKRNYDAMSEEKYLLLTPAEKNQINDRVALALSRIPQIRTYLNGLSTPARDAYLAEVITDPVFAQLVSKLHSERVKNLKIDDHDVTPLEEEYKVRDDSVKDKEKKVKDAEAELQLLGARLLAVGANGVDLKGVPPGARDARLASEKSAINTYSSTNPGLAGEVARYRVYRDQKALLDHMIAKATGAEKTRLTGQLAALDAATPAAEKVEPTTHLSQKNFLRWLDTADRAQLEGRIDQATAEKKGFVLEVDAAKAERATVDGKLQIAKHKRRLDEAKLAGQLEGVLGEAAIEYLDKELEGSEKVRQAEIAKLVGAEKDSNKARLLALLGNRWTKSGSGGLTKRVTSKLINDNIKSDYNKLIANGPEELMRQVMNSDSELKKLSRSNPDQFNELVKDSATQSEFMATLMQKRFEMGTIPPQEIRRIMGTSWGEAALDTAIKKNEKANEMIDKLRKDGVITGKLSEWLSKRNDFSVLAFIAAILGGMWGGATFAGALAAGASGMAISAGSAEAIAAGGAVAGGAGGGLLKHFAA